MALDAALAANDLDAAIIAAKCGAELTDDPQWSAVFVALRTLIDARGEASKGTEGRCDVCGKRKAIKVLPDGDRRVKLCRECKITDAETGAVIVSW
jgi:hypothetical protein